MCMALAYKGKLRFDGIETRNKFTNSDKAELICIMLGILIGHTCRKFNSDIRIGKLHIKKNCIAKIKCSDVGDVELSIDIDTNVHLLDSFKNDIGIDEYIAITKALATMCSVKPYSFDKFNNKTVMFKIDSDIHTGNIVESWLGDGIYFDAHKIVMEDSTKIIMSAKNLSRAMESMDEHDINKMKLLSINAVKPEEVLYRRG